MTAYPSRIVCLTEETTETLYILGEGERVVGVSAYTVRPPEARSKPRVSAFIHAHDDRIEALNPDLILGFSDLQGEIASDLIKRGYPVMVFNQRSVAGILQMIRVVGAMVGCGARADALAGTALRIRARLELQVAMLEDTALAVAARQASAVVGEADALAPLADRLHDAGRDLHAQAQAIGEASLIAR